MPMTPRQRSHVRLVSIFLAASVLGGCATYQDDTEELRRAWASGDDLTAAQEAKSEADSSPTGIDALLWRAEEGAAFRAADYYKDSNTAFSQAEARIDYYDKAARIRISDQALATVVNLSMLPYEGTSYDRIMVNTYKALNYLTMGDRQSARVEINRALQRQREAVRLYADAIEAAQEDANDASVQSRYNPQDNYNVNRATNDRKFQNLLDRNYGYLRDYRAYADYVVPFTVFLEGLYFMTNAQGLSDIERSRKAFERVRGMLPKNQYLSADYDLVVKRQNGEELPRLTYVIFETGMAPTRREVRIDIPLFLVTREVPYFGVAFPQLQFNNSYIRSVTAQTSGGSYTTEVVTNMDAVVAQAFENELPIIITRTLITAGVKAAAQYGIYQASKGDDTANAIAMVLTTAYSAATNRADLRTWVTLPKQFGYCRFPTPADGQVRLKLQGAQSLTVDLIEGHINVIYIKSNAPGATPSVSQFILKDADPATGTTAMAL